MTSANSLEQLLKSAISSFQTMVPVSFTMESTDMSSANSISACQYVSIGLTGDISGCLIIQGEESTFSSLALSMFGMEVEGTMLQSFICELGNMLAGNLATEATNIELFLDIMTPLLSKDAINDFSVPLVSLFLKLPDNSYLCVAICPQ
jgi:chemotaxis protein CheX